MQDTGLSAAVLAGHCALPPMLFRSDDDGNYGRGKTREEPTPMSIFSVSFLGFRGDEKYWHSG
jgi:hypothetical protein